MDTFRAIRRVLWITLALNLVAVAAKLVVGYMTGSLALIADGFDSVFDAASNVIGLVGVQLASQPADEDHPYGHRKAETMTALVIAALLFLTMWELVKSAIERLLNPALIHAEVNLWSFGALLLSILVHVTVVMYELRAGRRLQSDVLVADALHTRADIFVSLSVMAGLIAVRLGYPLADPILALVVAAFIAKIGFDIVRESSPTLMDEVMMPVDEVEQITNSVPGVISCHKVRSRGHESAVFADLHIQVDPATTTERAHSISHEVQRRLREHRPDIRDVVIHVEPALEPSGPGILQLAEEAVQEAALQIEGVSQCEQIEVGVSSGQYVLSLHCVVDGDISVEESHRRASELEAKIRYKLPQIRRVVVHVEPH